jgi:hypothetical protein
MSSLLMLLPAAASFFSHSSVLMVVFEACRERRNGLYCRDQARAPDVLQAAVTYLAATHAPGKSKGLSCGVRSGFCTEIQPIPE